MNIGVDCDGVLTDLSEFIIEYGKKWFRREPDNPSGYRATEVFGCSKLSEAMFGVRYFLSYCKNAHPQENSLSVIENFKKNGHGVYQITARHFAAYKNPLGLYSKKLYTDWIRKNNYDFDGTYFCTEKDSNGDKLRGCREYKVDIMIDDNPKVSTFLADNGIQVLLFDAPYNRGLEHKNIRRVHNWEEINEIVGSMNNE